MQARAKNGISARNGAQKTQPQRGRAGLPMRARVGIFALIVTPVLLLAAFSFTKTSSDLNKTTLQRREAVSFLAATNLKTKFDALVSVGTAYANDTMLRDSVEAGDWESATQAIDTLRESTPDVNSILLTDAAGIVQADSPALGTAGKSFSYSDWYQGISKRWQPYVSNVYKRSASPDTNGVAIAVPVLDGRGEVSGILVLQLSTESMLSWSRGIDLGKDAFVFFTDRQGQVAAHPLIDDSARIANFSGIDPVYRAMSTHSGVESAFDEMLGAKAIYAYSPVSGYGWTAVVEQPEAAAFADRDASIAWLFVVYAVIIALQFALAILVSNLFGRVIRQRNRERLFLESIGDGVLVTDAHGRVVSMNGAAEALLGRTSDKSVGKDFTEVITVLDDKGKKVPRDKRPLMRALRGEKSSEKLALQGAGERVFPASFTVTPVHEGHVVTGTVLVFRDITKEEELDRAKREFVSIASHQLLTPVSSSKGYLSMLLAGDMGDFTAAQKEYLSKLYQLNQRTVDLVDDLLNLSRVELGVLTSVVEPIDMVAFVRAELRAQETAMFAKRLVVEERFEPGMRPVIVPSRLLRIVVQNLLSNAVKYTPEHGHIRMELSFSIEGPPSVLLSIIDTGLGIPTKERARVFEKFYRAENARSAGIEGTGLGLYIVKSVADSLRATLWFESTVGKGTAFHIRIPVKIA